MPQSPIWFAATCGRQRTFLSQADADAYDDAFTDYPRLPGFPYGPAMDGWHDADSAQRRRDDRRARGQR